MSALTPDDAALVLRRAAELDTVTPEAVDRLDEQVLRAAARDVGLSGPAVEQAVTEWRAGALGALPALPRERRVGLPVLVGCERVHPLPADRVRDGLAAWLRGQWFEPRLHRGDVTDWAPRTGSLARARRAVDVHHRLRLADVRRLRVEVAADSRVRLTADLGDLRRGLVAGWVAAPAVAVGTTAGVLLGVGPELLLALPSGGAAGGVGWALARTTLERRRARVREELELALDALAAPPAASRVTQLSQLSQRGLPAARALIRGTGRSRPRG